MENKILVVDDEKEIADLLELSLQAEGFGVLKGYSAEEALALLAGEEPNLAILDVMLPEMDGFSLCRKLREKYTFPIILLTSRIASIDKINGLALGADDYVTKPFDPVELVARVKAQLRRYTKYNSSPESDRLLTAAGLCLDLTSHRCYLEDRPLELTPTEFAILRVLCQRHGGAVSAEELFHEIWNEAYYNKKTNPIPVHIRHLREKMGDSLEKPRIIKTVWGVGYKIES